MDQPLITLVEETLRMQCMYTSQSVLRNHFFFQNELLAEDVALKMCSSYFKGRQKGLYGVVRKVNERKPVIDLFFLHDSSTMMMYDDAMDGSCYNTISGGDMRIPLNDPLTSEEVSRSLFDGTYQLLIDERPELNASWVRVKPSYSFNAKDDSYEPALENSMKQIRFFLENYRPIKRAFVDVDFELHDSNLFSQFLVGAEFPFEDTVDGAGKLIEKAREVYGFLRC